MLGDNGYGQLCDDGTAASIVWVTVNTIGAGRQDLTEIRTGNDNARQACALSQTRRPAYLL